MCLTILSSLLKLNLKIVLECRKEIVNPHVQITILANNQYIADTASLLTGYQPAKFNEGENIIDCVFNPIILLPERSYFIRIAMREKNGLTPIIESQVIAKFEVNAAGSQIIMNSKFIGQIGDLPVQLTPYTITFNNSATYTWEGKRD